MKYILKYKDREEVAFTCNSLHDLSVFLNRDINGVYGSVWRLKHSGQNEYKIISYDGIIYYLSTDDDVKNNIGVRSYMQYKNITLIDTKTNEEYLCKDLWKVSKILNRPYSGVRKSIYNISRGNSNIIRDYDNNTYFVILENEV